MEFVDLELIDEIESMVKAETSLTPYYTPMSISRSGGKGPIYSQTPSNPLHFPLCKGLGPHYSRFLPRRSARGRAQWNPAGSKERLPGVQI